MSTNCNCQGSPVTPWDESVNSSLTQTLVSSGDVLIQAGTTYLNSTETTTQEATVPDGSRNMVHRLYIPKERITNGDSSTWTILGNFIGALSFTLNTIAPSLVIEWVEVDGVGGWAAIGGQYILNPQF